MDGSVAKARTPALRPGERARLAVMAAVILFLNAAGWAIFVLTVMPQHFHYEKLGVGLGVERVPQSQGPCGNRDAEANT